ncbi:MAG: hypothetical protein ACE5IR_16135 [bacterium]
MDKIRQALNKLDSWIEQNGWAGYDPYDIKEALFVIKITELGKRNFFFTVLRESLFELFYSFPITSRKILAIEKKINPKGMGLFAKSYLNLYQNTQEQQYLERSQECLNWLEENFSPGYSGACWGYPFHWQSKTFIPRGTPSGVVTAVVGDAFWAFYTFSMEKKYLELCQSICQFFMNDLNIDKIDKDRICFSYTPITHDHIHNANLFVAEFLIRVGTEIKNEEYINYGLRAVNYSLSYQNPDGSFYYFGPPDEVKKWVDNYHTGFVLRALYAIYKLTEDNKLLEKIGKCFKHYIDNFFIEKVIPKFQPNRIYPIDIHCCSEAILCLAHLSEAFSEGRELLQNVTNWTIDNMQDKHGYFYHAKRKSRFVKLIFTAKIPYMRWGQAWMLRALSELQCRGTE